jgi:hypothetical protein
LIVLKGLARRVLVIAVIVLLQGLQGPGVAAGIAPDAAQTQPSSEPGIAPGWLAFHTDAPLTFRNMFQHSLRLSPISPYYPLTV